MGQYAEIVAIDRLQLQQARTAPGECAARWSGLLTSDIIPTRGEGITAECERQDCERVAGAPCPRLLWLAEHVPDRCVGDLPAMKGS